MAVLISQDHPSTLRRTPASGDGGIDIMVTVPDGTEVLQVKGFVGRIGANEKRQIKRSIDEAATDPRLSQPITKYLLVVPTNPTPQEQAWFEGLAESYPWAIEWRGLDFWDSLASQHPHVIDYLLHGGGERVRERSVALQRAVIDPSRPLIADDVVGHIEVLRLQLQRDDPFYSYEIHSTIDQPSPDLLRGAVFAETHPGESGGYITIAIRERHNYALIDAPITIHVRAEPPLADLRFSQQFEDFTLFGTRLHLPTDAQIHITAPAGLGGSFTGGTIEVMESHDPLPPIRLATVGPDGSTIRELHLTSTSHKSGPAGGIEANLVDTSGTLAVRLRIHPKKDGPRRLDVDMSVGDIVGAPVTDVAALVQFMESATTGSRLELRRQHGIGSFGSTEPLVEDFELFDPTIARVLSLLARVQERADVVILVPERFDTGIIDYLSKIVRIWDDEIVEEAWDEVTLNLKPDVNRDEFLAKIKPGGALLKENEEWLVLGDQEVSLGVFSTVLASVRVAEARPRDGQAVHLVPGSDRRKILRAGPLVKKE